MIIGKNIVTKEDANIDLVKLISTRLLIQANSGGGKSWLIRRLLEQTHGKVQQIVLDLEGEFSTLREKYDYLLVGKDGEIPANIQTAELLAIKLLKLNVSTIIDLSELKKHERIIFVKRFLDSLVDAPRELWHTCLVIVDEAHQFCPEGKMSESGSSVIDLMTRGRKRGFCGVIATQRIAKLHKDAAAECNNVLVGRTVIDIDRKRASNDLGFTSKEQELGLKKLDDGEFFGYGPAISKDDYIKVKIGGVNTTHPEPGKNIIRSSKTPENIRKLLKDVIDLPKEVEEELKTKQDMQKRISELKRELRIVKASQSKPIIKVDERGLERAKEQGFRQAGVEYEKRINVLERTNTLYKKKLTDVGKIVGQETPKFKELPKFNPRPIQSEPQIQRTVTQVTPEVKPSITSYSNGSLRAGAMKMLNWLAGSYPESLTKQRLATLSGFSVKGGTFNTYISELKRNGWIVGNSQLSITEDGINNATPLDIPSGEQLLELWKSKFRQGAGKILQYVYGCHPGEVTKEDIGDSTGFEHSGGTFNTYLSELRRNGLIKINGGYIKISEEFFE